MKTRLRPLRALREETLSDLQDSPVAVLENMSPYLCNRLRNTTGSVAIRSGYLIR